MILRQELLPVEIVLQILIITELSHNEDRMGRLKHIQTSDHILAVDTLQYGDLSFDQLHQFLIRVKVRFRDGLNGDLLIGFIVIGQVDTSRYPSP